jgi:phospholipase/carboxylesterase
MTRTVPSPPDPHRGQPVLGAGEALERARAAIVMVHGRGASARDILMLSGELALPGFAYLAPQAANNTWYPNRFIVPTAQNEPWLSSALATVGRAVDRITSAGIPFERTFLLGFSQGACLALEYGARNGRRYGGLAGLSGGLIGADGEPRHDRGVFEGTPVFLGCSDVDPHIPEERVQQTAVILEGLGARVTLRLYPNMDHTVNQDEIQFVRDMMAAVVKGLSKN